MAGEREQQINRRKNNETVTVRSEKSLPDEDLRLAAYECGVIDCDWTIPGKLQFFEALPLFGKHNIDEHGGTIRNRLQRIYVKK